MQKTYGARTDPPSRIFLVLGSSSLHVNSPLVTRFMEEMSYVFPFTTAHFHLALVAASISHFFTAATNFSYCSSNEKMSPLFFISRFKSLPPFFSLSFAGLPPTFSFSLSFSCSIFQISGLDNLSKLNTLDNTDTETISRFSLY